MMNMSDFGFVNTQRRAAGVVTTRKAARRARPQRGDHSPAPRSFPHTANDGERFLRIVTQTAQIKRHFELFQLMQGEEVQHFIPHQVLISAWGDFDERNLKLDVISAIPGIRTGLLNRCSVDGLVKDLYKRWVAHGRQPMLIDSTMDVWPADAACGCALHASMKGVWSILVHGVADVRDGGDSLYLVLNATSTVNGNNLERFRTLADPLITQIDAAFRRIAALNSPALSANQLFAEIVPVLSAREEEILWWVAEGKTNVEIAKILFISAFTVKNHLKRIMVRLHATNRTEAAAKYRQMALQLPKNGTGSIAA